MQQWNPPPGGQQPSLEEIIEQLKRRWKKQGTLPIVLIAAGLAVAVLLFTVWFTVQPQETGIVQRFGKVVRTTSPGLHFKLPFGVETVQFVPTARVLKEEFGFRTIASPPGERARYAAGNYATESLMLTGDLNVIDVQWVIQYRIEDPILFLFNVRETSKTIRDISEAVMRRVVGNRLGSEVLTVDRVMVAGEARAEIQKILSEYETGVRLVTVELQDVTPPGPVQPAFNEVNEARQDRERTINQAQERANREIPKARGVAQQNISQAEGYALERINRAQGDATRFQAILNEYRDAPEVTRRRMHLEAMSEFLGELKGIYIVDSDQRAMLPFLTLDPGTPVPAGGGAQK
jgi:modulator of FtsH protease HflK